MKSGSLRPVRRPGRCGGPWWPRRARSRAPSGPWPTQWCRISAMSCGDLGAAGDRQRPALAEVVLHVDDDQRALHGSRALAAVPAPASADRRARISITGSPRDICWAAIGQLGARARGAASRAASSGSRPTTSPPRTSGTSSDRSSPSSTGGVADPDRPRPRRPRPRRGGAGRTCGRRSRSCPRSSSPPTPASPVVVLAGHQLVDEAAGRVARCRSPAAVPTPYPSTGAAASAAIANSSRSLVTMIRVLGRARASRAARAPGAASTPRSPESSRTAPSSGPATSTPSRDRLGDVVGVDQQRRALAQRRRPGRGTRRSSESCSSVKLCALVPAVGTPYRWRAARLELVAKPATYAARAAATAASSWVRREPISMQGRSPAASVIRDAAEAIAESWL